MKFSTIISLKQLPHARVLAKSFSKHHPGEKLSVLMVDDLHEAFDAGAEPFDLIRCSSLAIGARDFHILASIYGPQELATAMVPWLLDHLLGQQAGTAVYLDAEGEVLAPMAELDAMAGEHGIVVTPKAPDPLESNRRIPSEFDLLHAGVFSTGLIAVGDKAGPFLEWWSQRPRHEGEIPLTNGAVQPWLDLLPAYFDHMVLRDPAFNVSYASLNGHEVDAGGGRYTIDGQPIRYFHFDGFTPGSPYLLSRHQGLQPRVLLSENPAIYQLCEDYVDQLNEQGYEHLSQEAYGLGRSADGLIMDDQLRRICRHFFRLSQYDPGTTEEEDMPDPFDPREAGGFEAWLRSPDPRRPHWISRYLIAIYEERVEFQIAFPNLWGKADARRYLEWASRGGDAKNPVPPEMIPDDIALEGSVHALDPADLKHGFNIAGYMNAELGLGEASRLMVSIMEAGGFPYAVMPPFSVRGLDEQENFPQDGRGDPVYDTSIICLNAAELPIYIDHVGPEFLNNRYTIGYWAWELEKFPESMARSSALLDEIWVYGPYVQQVIAPMVNIPVYCCPLPVNVPEPTQLTKGDFGIPDRFMFYFCFDFNSTIDRKNPIAVIEAFKEAFAPGEGPVLVIKSMRGDRLLAYQERLKAAAAGRDDIIMMDCFLTRDRQNALMNVCDAYVSLHRAEGFGLTMAEAMALGKPVIATGYSGNLVFMDEENSYLVPHGFAEVPPDCGQYPEGTRWADPDVHAAARFMRHVHEHPEEAKVVAERGRKDILEKHSPAARVEFVRSRMDEIKNREKHANHMAASTKPPTTQDRAAEHLSRGPDLDAPVSFGRLGRFLRKATMRLLRHYDVHQRHTGETLLQAIREVDSHSTELEGHLRATNRTVERLARDLGKFDANFYETVSMPLCTSDSSGRMAIGYRGFTDGDGSDPYVGFEDIFRGSEEAIRDRQRFYLDRLAGHEPVIDIGCGRGEMLDLLAEAAIPAVGVDQNAGMVERCRAKGHDVVQQDALEFLAGYPDASAGAIFSAQFIEHLPYEKLLEYMKLAYAKLRPGGLLISETVNPHSVVAMKAFWIDLSHQKPVYPETAVVLHRLVGFEEAIVYFPGGSGKLEEDRRREGDYAVIGAKG